MLRDLADKRDVFPFYLAVISQVNSVADPVFLLGGGALVSCSTLTPIRQFFFCRIPVVLENRRSSQGGGGVRTPCPQIRPSNSTCNVKTGKDIDDSCPFSSPEPLGLICPSFPYHVIKKRRVLGTRMTRAPKEFFTACAMSGSVIKTFADERLLASNRGGQLSRETLLFSRHIQAPDDKICPS